MRALLYDRWDWRYSPQFKAGGHHILLCSFLIYKNSWTVCVITGAPYIECSHGAQMSESNCLRYVDHLDTVYWKYLKLVRISRHKYVLKKWRCTLPVAHGVRVTPLLDSLLRLWLCGGTWIRARVANLGSASTSESVCCIVRLQSRGRAHLHQMPRYQNSVWTSLRNMVRKPGGVYNWRPWYLTDVCRECCSWPHADRVSSRPNNSRAAQECPHETSQWSRGNCQEREMRAQKGHYPHSILFEDESEYLQ